MLTNEQKAVKREETAKRRQQNQLAKTLLPIAYKQALAVSTKANIDNDDVLGSAMLGLATAISKIERAADGSIRPGFYSFAKQYASGFAKNYLRDKSRTVRLPRDLTLAYLAEQKALRTPGFRELSDRARAEYLGLDLDVLVESRSAIALYDKDIDCYDGYSEQKAVDMTLQSAADQVQLVFDLGIAAAASAAKTDQASVSKQFYESLRIVLEAQDNA